MSHTRGVAGSLKDPLGRNVVHMVVLGAQVHGRGLSLLRALYAKYASVLKPMIDAPDNAGVLL